MKCVKINLPKQPAFNMDGTQVLSVLCICSILIENLKNEDIMSNKNAMTLTLKGSDLILPRAFIIEDFSSSSKYLRKNFEKHCGDKLHVNRCWKWVSWS